jgi:DNA-binding SARP family transcriptional activator
MPGSGPSEAGSGTAETGALRITSLGGLAVWQGDQRIPTSVWTRRRTATALLQFLLCAPGHHLPRERLIEGIWHPASVEGCEARLNATIHTLNSALGRPPAGTYVRSSGKHVVLSPYRQDAAPVGWLDACAFEQASRVACRGTDVQRCRLARALYTGMFLPEVVEADSDPDRWDYTHYIVERRQNLQELHADLLLHLAGLTDVPAEAIDCLQEILQADPCDERAAAMLICHYIEAGRLAFARTVYRTLKRALRAEHDDDPCAEIEQLRLELDGVIVPRRMLAS